MVEPIAKLRRRVNRARRFPDNTCPASRHLHMMAEYLIEDGHYEMLDDAPRDCAESILSVLEALWKARTRLAELGGTAMTLDRQHLARALYDAEWADADILQPWETASRSARRRYLRLADAALAYCEAARPDERRLWQAKLVGATA